MSTDWLEHVSDRLGLSARVPEDELLNVTRVVAHTVERKAAPLTAYLIGLAAAQGGASVEELSEQVIEMARAYNRGRPRPDAGADNRGRARPDAGADNGGRARPDAGADDRGRARPDAGADNRARARPDAGADNDD